MGEQQTFLPADALRRGVANFGSGDRFQRLGHKLLAGRPITVSFLGGSVTWGQVRCRACFVLRSLQRTATACVHLCARAAAGRLAASLGHGDPRRRGGRPTHAPRTAAGRRESALLCQALLRMAQLDVPAPGPPRRQPGHPGHHLGVVCCLLRQRARGACVRAPQPLLRSRRSGAGAAPQAGSWRMPPRTDTSPARAPGMFCSGPGLGPSHS